MVLGLLIFKSCGFKKLKLSYRVAAFHEGKIRSNS